MRRRYGRWQSIVATAPTAVLVCSPARVLRSWDGGGQVGQWPVRRGKEMGANGMRRHAIVVGLAAGGVLLSVLGTGGGAGLVATSGTIPRTLTAPPASTSHRIDQ